MKTWVLAWKLLWARPLTAALNLLLLTLGLASLGFVGVAAQRMDQLFERDLAGIDLVVGAKGSPLQLILSALLHIDAPTGNIALAEAQKWGQDPLVADWLALSLGDSVQGVRIVGSSTRLIDWYGARLAQGQRWQAPMQAVLGAQAAARLGLGVGDRFVGSHGVGAGGPAHAQTPYQVVGVLAASGSVIDRLVLTDSASVWQVHAAHGAGAADGDAHAAHEQAARASAHDAQVAPPANAEITAMLIRYRSPLAAVSLPRRINAASALQAAAPAYEMARLLSLLGVGVRVLQGFALLLLALAGLSVFVALWTAVHERRADLALSRLLGAPPARLVALVLAQALCLASLAAGAAVALAQAGQWGLAWALRSAQGLVLPTDFDPLLAAGVFVLAWALALLAALAPAWWAYRVQPLQGLQGVS